MVECVIRPGCVSEFHTNGRTTYAVLHHVTHWVVRLVGDEMYTAVYAGDALIVDVDGDRSAALANGLFGSNAQTKKETMP